MRGRIHFFGIPTIRSDHVDTLAVADELIVAPKPTASTDGKDYNDGYDPAKFDGHFLAR
jgi:hypothetical protein